MYKWTDEFTGVFSSFKTDGKSFWFHSDGSDDSSCNGSLICAVSNHTLFSIDGIVSFVLNNNAQMS